MQFDVYLPRNNANVMYNTLLMTSCGYLIDIEHLACEVAEWQQKTGVDQDLYYDVVMFDAELFRVE